MTNRYIKIPYDMIAMGFSGKALILYGIILNLAFRDDVYATNGYLANCLNCTVRQVQNLLKELEQGKAIEMKESNKGHRLIKPLIINELLLSNDPRKIQDAPHLSETDEKLLKELGAFYDKI